METMRNRGTKIKEVFQFTIASYAIHLSTRSMAIHINQLHKKCFETKSPMHK